MRAVVAVDAPHAAALARGLEREGVEVIAVVEASAPALASADAMLGPDAEHLTRALASAELLVLQVSRDAVTQALVAACDRAGVRIVPLCEHDDDRRVAAAFGLDAPRPMDLDAARLVAGLAGVPAHGGHRAGDGAKVIAVWGPAGAPGRSTVAVELAVELARGGRHVALVDADSHAPSLALALGLADEGPGFAAACRQASRGSLDARELTRISIPLGQTGVDVLTGINRASRWPELSEERVTAALASCREWAEDVVVDVSSSLERDEEIMSDLDAPRRNAATLAALRAADLVVAVTAADPIGIARLLKAYPDLRAAVGSTRVVVLANRLRPGALGIDARGQVRRTLDRFAGIDEVWFLPQDPRSADSALLTARPVAEVAPKSPLVQAIRRFVGEAVAAPRRSAAVRRAGSAA